MLDTHTVHATATFSELGIATASILIADIPKWRELVQAGQADPIEVENLAVMANKVGGIHRALNSLANIFPDARILFWVPFLSFAMGFYSLIGISVYPPAINGFSIFAFDKSQLDDVYWWMAIASFGLAMFSAIMERSKAKLVSAATITTGTDFNS